VTGETFYAAEDVIAMLPDFRIEHTFPCLATNMWITAMVRLFAPQIAALLRERDKSIAAWQQQYPDRDVFEDRELEMTSYLPISVSRQITTIDRLLRR
jgi:predicted lipoprotein